MKKLALRQATLTTLFVLFSAFAFPQASHAADCPVPGDADAIDRAITSASGCAEAAEIAESCAFGSNIDLGFVDSATTVCERTFPQRTVGADLRQYRRLLSLCEKKYANHDGSLFRSEAAFCRLNVTRAFEAVFSPPED